ncbi:MAG: DUF4351 domain-containing protein [Planctomycetaceae bacterium]|jgi:hypothetical protein|nr:DUF4351 domain-containing protein [Planctomycetaceae bacterium]
MSGTNETITIPPWIEESLYENFVKGEAKGEIRGEARGILLGKAEMIFAILTKRFKQVAPQIRKQLLTITDLEQLNKLADSAFDSESLDVFEAALEETFQKSP